MSLIAYGADVTIKATFTDPDTATAVDPSAVRCYVKRAGQSETLYTYGTDANLTRLALGSYQCVITKPTASSSWFYRWEADYSTLTSSYPGDFLIGPNRA